MSKIYLLIAISTLYLVSNRPVAAQPLDNQKLKNELEITRTVVNELFKKSQGIDFEINFGGLIYGDDQAMVSYFEGFGLLIQAPKLKHSPVMYANGPESITIQGQTYPAPDIDSLVKVRSGELESTIRLYFANYARLINALKPGEKIRLQYNHWVVNKDFVASLAIRSKNNKGQSNFKGYLAEVTFEDLNDFKKGKIQKEAFLNSMKLTKLNDDLPVGQDISILGNILKKVLENVESYRWIKGSYNHLPGLGVIFEYSLLSGKVMYFSNGADNNMFFSEKYIAQGLADLPPIKALTTLPPIHSNINDGKSNNENSSSGGVNMVFDFNESKDPCNNRKGKDKTEKQHKPNSDATITEESTYEFNYFSSDSLKQKPLEDYASILSEPLLLYGTTLTSIGADEMILIKLKDSKGSTLQLSIPMKVVWAYEKGEIPIEEAKRRIIINMNTQ